MKKVLSLIILFAFAFLLLSCDSNIAEDVSSYTIDYFDAESFESALNDGKKVKGNVIQLCVEEYVPDSILGINCHAGEHLNFLFENELDVEMGDTIIVHIIEEPSKVFLIGSWKVPCEFIEIVAENPEKDIVKEVNTESVKEQPIDSKELAGAPDIWTKLLEKHYKEVKKQFEDAGFTNITCVAHEIDYNENYVFEGSVVNIAIGENGEICTFEKDEQWSKDIKIRIDYRVKPVQDTSSESKKTDSSKTQSNGDNSEEISGVTVPKQEESKGNLVWVPTNGGTKYHSRAGCSGMKNPMQVSVETAKSNGYTPCARCH